MKRSTEITALFLDIGGVLLTDGWDHRARRLAVTNFNLELGEMEDRHHLTFDTYEEGLGIRSVLHTDYRSTGAKLAAFGFPNEEGFVHEIR